MTITIITNTSKMFLNFEGFLTRFEKETHFIKLFFPFRFICEFVNK